MIGKNSEVKSQRKEDRMRKHIKEFCPICFQERDVQFIDTYEDVQVRGEKFRVRATYFKCTVCGEEFEDFEKCTDPLDTAFREYRKCHQMLQPEEIKRYRRLLGLTQKELAQKVHIGEITLSRYENGALQKKVYDKALRNYFEREMAQRKSRGKGIFKRKSGSHSIFLKSFLKYESSFGLNSNKNVASNIFTKPHPLPDEEFQQAA